jgi:predicted DCC family thiol-disulfide oxidoreductase YuxK
MSTAYPLTLFYDASCAVCSLEMDHLRSRNHDGKLAFVDITAPGFDPAPFGATLAAMDAQIHGRCADGQMIIGVQALRLAYEAVGLGWVLRPTAWPPLRALSDVGYRLFARHRRRISRAAAPVIDAIRTQRARRMSKRMRECASGACEMPANNNRRPS